MPNPRLSTPFNFTLSLNWLESSVATPFTWFFNTFFHSNTLTSSRSLNHVAGLQKHQGIHFHVLECQVSVGKAIFFKSSVESKPGHRQLCECIFIGGWYRSMVINKSHMCHVLTEIQLVFCGAALCALNKKDGGIRTVAVGSTLYVISPQSIEQASNREDVWTLHVDPAWCRRATSDRSYREHNSSFHRRTATRMWVAETWLLQRVQRHPSWRYVWQLPELYPFVYMLCITTRRYLVSVITCCIPTKAFNNMSRLDRCSFVCRRRSCPSRISDIWMSVCSAASSMIFHILIRSDELIQRSACCSMRTSAKLSPTMTM